MHMYPALLLLNQAKIGSSQIKNINNDAKRDLLAALSSVQDNGVYGLEVSKAYHGRCTFFSTKISRQFLS